MTNWIVLPTILPLLLGSILLVWRTPSVQRRWASALTFIGLIAVSKCLLWKTLSEKILILPMGGWKAPFGIFLSLDTLGAIMVTLALGVSLAALVYGFAQQSIEDEHPMRIPLIFFLVAGINLSFTTGDFFNLFVAFEIMLISSYSILTLEIKEKDVRHALPYLAINLIGSALFLCAGGIFYALFGSLNFADIAQLSAGYANDPRLIVASLMLVLIFGLKAGFFPLYYWMPNSYPSLPTPLAAIFAGLLTKVGIYVIIRIFVTVLPHTLLAPHQFILILAVPTMIIGILSALTQRTIRGVLCFNLVSHIGFMMVGIGILTEQSIAASIFYMMHHVLVIASLFLITGVVYRISGTDELESGGNIWKKAPWVGVLFLVQALALTGIPPLSGFWGKAMILQSAIEGSHWILVGSIVIASVLTLLSMIRIWFAFFWRDNPSTTLNLEGTGWKWMSLSAFALVLCTLVIGFAANPYIRLAQQASSSLFDRDLTINKVLSSPDIKSQSVHSESNGGHH
ncbi:hypothetical protein HOH87_02955 [bacterium]|jgi:multicomponent Na+:H+ antiporter subunit D|nr:hypothetical protein [bacterium]